MNFFRPLYIPALENFRVNRYLSIPSRNKTRTIDLDCRVNSLIKNRKMGLKPIYILMVFTFLHQDVSSQNRKVIDSLLVILTTTKPDTSHVEAYVDLYYQYYRTNLDTAMKYAHKGKVLAEELKYTKGLANVTYWLGSGYTDLLKLDLAEQEFIQSASFSELLNDKKDIAEAYSGLGSVYFEKNEFDKAASAYLKALGLLESTNYRNSEAKILNDLGTLYKTQRQYDKALTYYEDALAIVRELNFQPGISACLMNVGSVYLSLKQYHKALPYLNESLSIKKMIGDKLGESRGLLKIGDVHRELRNYDLAHDHYIRALAIAKEVVNPAEINTVQYSLALNEFQRGHFETSLSYGEESLVQSRRNNDLEMDIKTRTLLGDTYAALNQPVKAYEYARMVRLLSDSLYDEKMISVSAELDAKYQYEKKEKEIADLNSANELNALQLQKRVNERNYLIGLTLLTLLLGMVIWSRYRIKVKANEKLKELDHSKSRFFANISHEFRTPLTLISGYLEDLKNDVEDNKDQIRLAVMQKNTQRLQQLIDQLLDLSRLESGKLKLNVEPASPGNFLRAITSSFSSWAMQKELTLSIDLPEQQILAYFDQDVLEKIVGNLLSNAIKFTPVGGKVIVSAKWNADELNIQIKDNGPGIPPSNLDRIFERFYQVDDSNTRKQGGSGIGLALVKELVSLHHGQVTVESHPGKGTEFNVAIPTNEKYYLSSEIGSVQKDPISTKFAKVDENGSDEAYPEFAVPTPENPIILVVEDNLDLGHYIGDHLPECGIILAADGIDGFNKAIQHVPDLIISDVMMPEMDGVELCKKLKEEEKTSHIPVILLTAKADIESRLEGLETGADDYMTKPFDARELQTRVKNLILQREKLRARFSRTVVLKPKDIAITSRDEIFLEKVMAIIESHLGDSEFTVEDFQKEIGMSRMQLHRKLKALTGHSAGEFVRIQRLVRASDMLSKTDDNISEVCYQTGFTSLSYFAKCFKKQFGTTPKEYASSHSSLL